MEFGSPVATAIVTIITIGLALIFKFAPKVSNWYYGEKLSGWRGLVMVGIVTLVTVAIYPISCYSPWQIVECVSSSWWQLAVAWFVALTSNQIAYLISPESAPEQEAKVRKQAKILSKARALVE